MHLYSHSAIPSNDIIGSRHSSLPRVILISRSDSVREETAGPYTITGSDARVYHLLDVGFGSRLFLLDRAQVLLWETYFGPIERPGEGISAGPTCQGSSR